MTRLVLECYVWLILSGTIMRLGKIRAVHKFIRLYKVHPRTARELLDTERLCHAMDLACALYPKRVLCLQRSAATVFFLRRHGWEARCVVGAQILPFKSHAWVEVNGAIVSDKPYIREMYQVLDLL